MTQLQDSTRGICCKKKYKTLDWQLDLRQRSHLRPLLLDDVDDVVCKISLNDDFILRCDWGTTGELLREEPLSLLKIDVCKPGKFSIELGAAKKQNQNEKKKNCKTHRTSPGRKPASRISSWLWGFLLLWLSEAPPSFSVWSGPSHLRGERRVRVTWTFEDGHTRKCIQKDLFFRTGGADSYGAPKGTLRTGERKQLK